MLHEIIIVEIQDKRELRNIHSFGLRASHKGRDVFDEVVDVSCETWRISGEDGLADVPVPEVCGDD